LSKISANHLKRGTIEECLKQRIFRKVFGCYLFDGDGARAFTVRNVDKNTSNRRFEKWSWRRMEKSSLHLSHEKWSIKDESRRKGAYNLKLNGKTANLETSCV
jgi:hypothetical protein